MFADTDELEVRWRPLTDEEKAKADLLISDLSREAKHRFPDLPARVGTDPDYAADVSEAICSAVRRRMTWELDHNEQDGPDPDVEEFTSFELARLRGGQGGANATSPATALWSNDDEGVVTGAPRHLGSAPAVFGP